MTDHQHPMEPRWALDGIYGRIFHLVWEVYHGEAGRRSYCGRLPISGVWRVTEPSQQQMEDCKLCRWLAEERGFVV